MSALLAGTGALFWLVVYAAAYRGKRQDVRSPEVVHVVFVGVGCVLSGIGFFLLAGGLWGAELGAVDAVVAYLGAAFGCLGMALVAIPIYWSLPAGIAQPTRQECDEARAALQAEIDRLRTERNVWMRRAAVLSAEAIRDSVHSPWLSAEDV